MTDNADKVREAQDGERRARELCDTIEARSKETLAEIRRVHKVEAHHLRTENAALKAALRELRGRAVRYGGELLISYRDACRLAGVKPSMLEKTDD